MKGDNIGEYSSVIATDGKCLRTRPIVFIDHPRNEGAFELVKHALTEHLNLDSLGLSDEIAVAFLASLRDYEPPIERGAAEVVGEPEPETCAACGGTDLMACQYTYDHPHHYDGISEYHCACGARTGRWSKKILKEGESERPFGRD